jgi:hypothetical protein
MTAVQFVLRVAEQAQLQRSMYACVRIRRSRTAKVRMHVHVAYAVYRNQHVSVQQQYTMPFMYSSESASKSGLAVIRALHYAVHRHSYGF